MDSYKDYFIVKPIDVSKKQINGEYTFTSENQIAKDSLKIENKEIRRIKLKKK